MNIYLKESDTLNYSHKAIKDFVGKHTKTKDSLEDQAVSLFYAVRDGFLYNPYYININQEDCQASKVVDRGFGHCIDKASLLISCYRAIGLPARIGLAKVKNHIATEKLEKYLGSNVLTPHGYVEVLLNATWWKVTPAFNRSLCEKLGVTALEFNGSNHCLFQEYNQAGEEFMEYVHDYGTFEDIPWNFIVENMKAHYPRLRSQSSDGVQVQIDLL